MGWRTSVDSQGVEALTRYEAVAAYKSKGYGKTQRYTQLGYACLGFKMSFRFLKMFEVFGLAGLASLRNVQKKISAAGEKLGAKKDEKRIRILKNIEEHLKS